MPLQYATVSPAELRGYPDLVSGVRLLDVRTPGEFAGARIAGSHNVPLPELGRYAGDLARAGTAGLIVVCQTGVRSRQAAEVLHSAGHGGVRVLEGGVAAWEAHGGELEIGAPAWALERQVRLVAGSLVAGSILASLKFPKARFLAGAVGSGLVVAAATNTCLMGNLLAKLPYNRAAAGDVDAAIAALTGS